MRNPFTPTFGKVPPHLAGRQEIKEGVFDSTYRELSNGDLKFLYAMLPDAHGSTLADVSTRMGVKSNYSTKYKSRLLNRGVIGNRPDGTLDFDLPGFREYLCERKQRASARSHE